VARDRKRAKQRRERRARTSVPASTPQRADVPGALDHASSDVDEFDAALIAGAGGVTATPESDAPVAPAIDAEEDLSLAATSGGGGGDSGDGAGAGGHGGGSGGSGGSGGDHLPGAPLRGGNRVLAFFRASWAELQRVQWPDRRQVTQATAVVLGFVAIAGAYLGLADYVAKELVEFIL
jgi:preprotein translocase subunit SecE